MQDSGCRVKVLQIRNLHTYVTHVTESVIKLITEGISV